MLVWRHHMFSEERSVFRTESDRFTIGRSSECDIALPSAYVPALALEVERVGGRFQLEALADSVCDLAGSLLRAGERVDLSDDAELRLSPFVLRFDLEHRTVQQDTDQAIDEQVAVLIRETHAQLLDTLGIAETDTARDRGSEHLLRLEHTIEEIALTLGLSDANREPRLRRLAGHALRNLLIDRVIGDTAGHDPITASDRTWVKMVSAVAEREVELEKLATRVERLLGAAGRLAAPKRMQAIEGQFWECWRRHIKPLHEFLVYLAAKEVKKQVKDLVFGYGAIEDLLRLPTISEIMVVGHDRIYVEKRSKEGATIENSGRRFVSEAAAMAVIERIVTRCNRRIDQSTPLVDARLDDGSRVNAVIPPIAVAGPALTIRKFPARQHKIADWLASGGLTPMAEAFLRAAVQGRKNILVSGGTGAGKTTLLNCLADWIDDRERVVTIEDTAELQLAHDHVVPLQTRVANAEQQGVVSTRDLVKNALRMRPDRIVVGECRGAEAIDMLNAMNTGHDGSMTTLHANSPFEVPRRLESMVKLATDISETAAREQIASSIDLIVQVEKKRGSGPGPGRYVASIAEVRRAEEQDQRLEVVELFSIYSAGEAPELRSTGRLPSFAHELLEKGLLGLEAFCPPKPAEEPQHVSA